MTLCLSRPRRNETLVQQARGRLRRQVRGRRRAALNERAGFGLEVVHVSLDAGDAAHPVAVVFTVVGRLVPNLQGRLGAFYGRVGFKTESGDGDDPATTPIPEDGGGVGGLGFRFRETPARFGEARLEVARSLPGARDLLQTSLEAFGHPDAIETLDFAQSSLEAEGAQHWLEARELGFLRLELGSPRGELVARFHELLDAARPFLHPCWRTRTDADLFPKLPPTLLRFCERRRRARFGGLRQSVPARLFVEPLGFQSMLSQTRGVFNRVIRQTIRLPLEALEFGDVGGERSLRRSLGRPEYRRAQRPPRRLAARSRLRNAVGRRQRTASRKLGKARRSFRRSPSPPPSRALAALTRRTRSRLECVGELSKILGARHGQPGERFEVDDRRIEPRGGVCELERRPSSARSDCQQPCRASSAILPRAAYFSRNGVGSRSAPCASRAMRASSWDFCAWES